MSRFNGNFGIVLYLKGTPGGATYLDYKGVTRSVGTLSTSYQASDEFHVGRGQDLVITAQGVLAGGLTIDWALQVKHAAAVDSEGVTHRWGQILPLRLLDGDDGTAGVHTITAAYLLDLLDGATAGAVHYGTTSQRTSGSCRLIAKSSGAPAGSDLVVFSVGVG
jgi:hypothetical protein